MARLSAGYATSVLIASVTLPGPSVAQARLDARAAAPLVWAECQPGQVEVLILGTFHFAQADDIDVLDPARQRELGEILDRLAGWAPRRVAVEYPHARQAELDSSFASFRDRPKESQSRNETVQLGFRLAHRLGHDRLYAVDVPINLWHDSIQVFDDQWPTSRTRLRALWPLRFEDRSPKRAQLPLAETLRALNRDAVPGNSGMYAGFLPLVEDETYAGALKLRPWYDRNLRIVQNVFRASDPSGDRVLLIIGSGHLRVLKQIMEITPQLCPVSALPTLDGPTGSR